LTVEEAAAILRISRGSAYEAVRKGQIPTLRIGRRLLVSRARLMAMIEAGGLPQGGPWS
jgi:excisionase family DNA binding protein